MNDLSCGIRMWAQVSFVLSQITRLTDRRTDEQRFHGYAVRCITCSRTVKTAHMSTTLEVPRKHIYPKRLPGCNVDFSSIELPTC